MDQASIAPSKRIYQGPLLVRETAMAAWKAIVATNTECIQKIKKDEPMLVVG